MTRAQLFQKTCHLIACDRKGTRRDDGHHRWLVGQVDACAAAISKMFKDLNRMLDAYTS
jgi:hypothetical protein